MYQCCIYKVPSCLQKHGNNNLHRSNPRYRKTHVEIWYSVRYLYKKQFYDPSKSENIRAHLVTPKTLNRTPPLSSEYKTESYVQSPPKVHILITMHQYIANFFRMGQ